VDNDSGGDDDTITGDVPKADETSTDHGDNGSVARPSEGRLVELLQEERDAPTTPIQLGDSTNRYKAIQQTDNGSEDGSAEALPRRPGSPIESILSIPDDTPSVQVARPPAISGFG